MAYPSTVNNLLTAAADSTSTIDPTYDHATNHNNVNVDVNALTTLLGIPAQTTPTGANRVFVSTSATETAWTGTPTLTSVTAGAFIDSATHPAATGVVRLANLSTIQARNAANGADINLIYLDASNHIQIDNSATGSFFGGALTVGGTLTVGANTLALAGSTVSGTPTWSSNQAITLSTAAQPNITSVGILSSPHFTTATVDSGGLQVTSGNVGIGGAPLTNAGLSLPASYTVGASGSQSFGAVVNPTLPSGATSLVAGLYTQISTAAASFTVTQAVGLYSDAIQKGSGSTITSAYGVLVNAQTAGGTNNYGIYVNTPSGGSSHNVAISVGGSVAGNGTPAISATAPNGSDTVTLVRATDSAPSGNFIAAYTAALSATLFAVGIDGGVTVGTNPTGGDKGSGTINVATNIFLNGTAYTSPDYVLEQYATGKIVRYADKPGASTYQHLTLPQMESYVKSNYALPGFGQNAGLGLFDGGDHLLANLEDSYVYLFDHEHRLAALEARLAAA